MKKFERGVSYYTHGTVEIDFPEDDICCRWCPLMASEYRPNREYCQKTGEYLVAPDSMVGEKCPMVFSEEGNR
nr:MAG TPA: hypothetical protein [Caudoviricetes sp.]